MKKFMNWTAILEAMSEKLFNKNKFVLVSDFDGTISKKDFFRYAIENIISKENMKPWQDYKDGKITHVEALNRIFQSIKLPQEEFDAFIDTIEVEEYFIPTIELCKTNKIDVYVVSAGADYYISRILKNLNISDDVTLITNPSKYTQKFGLELFPVDKSSEFYDKNLGISKKYFVEKLQKQGYSVLFAGDGIPDIDAASVADIVFAKDCLIDLCDHSNIKYNKFDSYLDIYNFISNC